jgi:hypothetical protein
MHFVACISSCQVQCNHSRYKAMKPRFIYQELSIITMYGYGAWKTLMYFYMVTQKFSL